LDDCATVGRIKGYSDGSSLSFFDPYFYADREKLVVDQQYSFTLAALAFEYAKSTGWDYDPKRGLRDRLQDRATAPGSCLQRRKLPAA
jgi:hypothetical protein